MAFESRDSFVSITPQPQYFPGKNTQQKIKLPQPPWLNCFSWISSPTHTNDAHPVLWTVHVVNKKIEKVQGNLMTCDFLVLGG